MDSLLYLDNAATTPMSQEALETFQEKAKSCYGNSSSIHRMGQRASLCLEGARRDLLSLLFPKESSETPSFHPTAIFTSGGTESDNLAILGRIHKLDPSRKKKFKIGVSITEHSAVLKTVEELKEQGHDVAFLPIDSCGVIKLDELSSFFETKPDIFSIHHVNNETGAIQPIEKIGALLREKSLNTFYHSDCVQSFGKIKIPFKEATLDAISISSHKIHGPKGVGALILKEKTALDPISFGGGHEAGVRSGTVNVPGIASFVTAAKEAIHHLEVCQSRCHNLKNRTIQLLNEQIKAPFRILCPNSSIPQVLSILFPEHEAAILARMLDDKGICVSSGSACSSQSRKPNRILQAMGLPTNESYGALRISFSRYLDETAPEKFVRTLHDILKTY